MVKGKKKHSDKNDPRQIVLWTRRYAQNRTISFLVQWVFIVVMVVVIGVAAILTQTAHKQDNQTLFFFSVGLMGVAIICLAWFSLSRWSGDLIFSITNRLYGREGYVSYSGSPKHKKLPLWLTGLGGGLIVYHLVGALLISFSYMHIQYLQPWSALYMTPYLIIMVVYQRLGFWAWLWPILYGIHAILMLCGAPVRFERQYELLNIAVPVFGYGLFAIMVGHIYSRYALWKLKKLTRNAIPDTNVPEFPNEDGPDAEVQNEENGHG